MHRQVLTFHHFTNLIFTRVLSFTWMQTYLHGILQKPTHSEHKSWRTLVKLAMKTAPMSTKREIYLPITSDHSLELRGFTLEENSTTIDLKPA